jgi:hypothetical protein
LLQIPVLDQTAYRYAIVGLAAAVGLFLIGVSVIAAVGHEVPKELWTLGTALGGGLLGMFVPSPQATPGAKAVAESAVVQSAAASAAAAQANREPAAIQAQAQQAAAQVRGGKNLRNAISAASASSVAGAASVAVATAHDATALGLAEQAEAPGLSIAKRDALNAQANVYRAAAEAARDPKTQAAAHAAAQSAPKGQADNKDYFNKLGPPAFVFIAALTLGSLLTVGVIAPAEAYQSAAIHEGNGLIALATAAGGAIVGVLAPAPGQATATTT